MADKLYYVRLALPLWRELHHPVERWRWRCRPTVDGVELGILDAGATSWTTRTPRPVRLPDGVRERELTEMAARERHARAAIALVEEQLEDGLVEDSAAAGGQLWALLHERWEQAGDALFAAQASIIDPATADVAAWLVAASTVARPTKVHGPDSFESPTWWPAISASERSDAIAALRANADRVIAAAILALRAPGFDFAAGQVLREVLLAAAPPSDELADVAFDALIAQIPRSPGMLSKVVAHLCAVTETRVERLVSVVRASPVESERDDSAFVLAAWSADDRAFEALRGLARERVMTHAVFRAVRVQPRRAWLEFLREDRVASSERAELAAAIASCTAAD